MQPQLNRRRFLGFLLLSAALVRCKKDTVVAPKKTVIGDIPKTSGSLPSPGTSDYLAQFSVTEAGTGIVPPDPTFNKTINGYNDKISYNAGDTVNVYLSGPANEATNITLYDTQISPVFKTFAAIKPQTIKSTKPWVEGFMYNKTFSFNIPSDFRSGVYTWNNSIPFVVKNSNKSVDITVIYPSNTINAYNYAGGKSLYEPDVNNRALVVSYLRSNIISYQKFYKWLDEQAYSINYVADCDMDDYNEIADSKLVIITGHSEYWTKQARQNIDTFVQSGRDVLVLSGNTMWWQVRYAPKQNAMICYKGHPADPLLGTQYNTINWYQKSLNYPVYPSIGVDYTEGGFGQVLTNRWNGYKIVNDESPLFAGTGLKNGDMLDIQSTEYDCVPLVKMIPPGSTELPEIDRNKLNCYKAEILGYDFAQNLVPGAYKQQGVGTFVVYQQSETSGTVVNAATMDWCWYIIFDQFQTITKNMIELSLNGKSLFSPKA